MNKLSLRAIMESITEENKKSGQMIAHFIPVSDAKKLKKYGDGISGEALKLKDMHITLGFVRSQDKAKQIASALKLACQYFDPFKAAIDQLEVFPPSENSNNMQILVALVSSEDLLKFKNLIFDIFSKFKIDVDNGDFEFKPHITIKYCNPDEQIDISEPISEEIPIDDVSFSEFGKIKTFKLGENK